LDGGNDRRAAGDLIRSGAATWAGYLRRAGTHYLQDRDNCEVGIGTPVKLKFVVNVEALPAGDKDRLNKQCKPTGNTMCIVAVQGTEMSDPMKVKATKITFYN
jgi:hypothetical protein